MIKKYITIILLFFFVFGIPIKGLPINSSKIVLVLLLIIVLLSGKLSGYKIKSSFFKLIFPFILLTIVSFIYSLIHNTGDFSVPYAYLIIVLEGVLGSYLIYFFFFKNKDIFTLINAIINIGFFQAIIIILMFLSSIFREFIYSISKVDAEQLMDRYGGFRGFGLAGSVTYDLAVFLSIILMLISFQIVNKKGNTLFYLLAFPVILIAVLMTGRSGWIGFFMAILILVYGNNIKLNFKIVFYVLIFSTLFIFSIPVLIKSYSVQLYDTLFLEVVPYAFEMFINYSENDSFSTGSSDTLSNMYFTVPWGTFFLGDGFFINPNGLGYYMHTDAGYMRHLLYYGIFPSLILYLGYINGFYKLLFFFKNTHKGSLLISLLCCFYFIIQIKGNFLTGSAMNIKLFCLFLVYVSFYSSITNNLIKK